MHRLLKGSRIVVAEQTRRSHVYPSDAILKPSRSENHAHSMKLSDRGQNPKILRPGSECLSYSLNPGIADDVFDPGLHFYAHLRFAARTAACRIGIRYRLCDRRNMSELLSHSV